jgi:glucosamine--fructose-6-phosphate aminotransferase (isomerizing)
MTTFGQFTYPEISSQHEALREAWDQLKLQQDWIKAYLNNPAYDEIIFIGSGSSYYQALTMASTCRSWLNKSAAAFPSSELFLFKEQTTSSNRNYLVIGVSRSGESTEVLLALESLRTDPHFTTAGITCYENSTMAQMAPSLVSLLEKKRARS